MRVAFILFPRSLFQLWNHPFCVFFLLSPLPQTQLTHVKARGQERNMPERQIAGRTRKSKTEPSRAAAPAELSTVLCAHHTFRPPALSRAPLSCLALAVQLEAEGPDPGGTAGSPEWPLSRPRAGWLASEPGGARASTQPPAPSSPDVKCTITTLGNHSPVGHPGRNGVVGWSPLSPLSVLTGS